MTAIMNAHVIQLRAHPNALPRLVEVRQVRLRFLSGDHPRVAFDTGDAGEHRFHRRRQGHPPRAGLRVPEPQLPRRAVDIVPPQRHDLVLPAPAQQQEPHRRDGRGHDRAVRLRLVQHPAEPPVLLRIEEPLAAMLLVAAHRPARVAPRRREPPGLGQPEHLREHAHRLVRLIGLVAHLVVERRDVGALHLPDREVAELGQDVELDDSPESLLRPRPAVHLYMDAHVPLGQAGYGELGLGLGLRRRRVLAALDAVDEDGGLAPRLGGGDLAGQPDGGALRSARAARLHAPDLAPGAVDTHPEAGQVAVPEDRVPAFDRERLDGAAGKLECVLPGHESPPTSALPGKRSFKG